MRKKKKLHKYFKPDARFNRVDIARFINRMMLDGKKTKAEKVVYDALDIAAKETKQSQEEVFEAAIKNVSPSVEVRSRRVGGANYQVPYEVRPGRQFALAIRWIISSARSGKGTGTAKRLADELIAASQGEGAAVRKKQEMHRMAEANRAFAHFAR